MPRAPTPGRNTTRDALLGMSLVAKRKKSFKKFTYNDFQRSLGLQDDRGRCNFLRQRIRTLARKHFDYTVTTHSQTQKTWDAFEKEICTEEPVFVWKSQRLALKAYTKEFLSGDMWSVRAGRRAHHVAADKVRNVNADTTTTSRLHIDGFEIMNDPSMDDSKKLLQLGLNPATSPEDRSRYRDIIPSERTDGVAIATSNDLSGYGLQATVVLPSNEAHKEKGHSDICMTYPVFDPWADASNIDADVLRLVQPDAPTVSQELQDAKRTGHIRESSDFGDAVHVYSDASQSEPNTQSRVQDARNMMHRPEGLQTQQAQALQIESCDELQAKTNATELPGGSLAHRPQCKMQLFCRSPDNTLNGSILPSLTINFVSLLENGSR